MKLVLCFKTLTSSLYSLINWAEDCEQHRPVGRDRLQFINDLGLACQHQSHASSLCLNPVVQPSSPPPLWLRRSTVSLLLTLVLTHCLLVHVHCISLFMFFFSFPPRSHPLWPPVPPHITQLKNVTAVEGSAAMISCMADGEPLPDISWRRASDGQTFVDGDKVKSAPVFLSHYILLAQAEYHHNKKNNNC